MFQVRVNPNEVLARLGHLKDRQTPFIVSLALNKVANEAQGKVRDHMKKAFHLRRAEFNLRGIYISKADRATKASWRVVIQVKMPDDRHYLEDHEQGTKRVPHKGKWLWQPNSKVFRSKVIGRANPLHPKNLHLKKVGKSIRGDQRTFIVKTPGGERLLLQRVDRKLDGRSAKGLKSITLDNFAGGMGPRTKKEKRSIRRTVGTQMLYRLVAKVRIPARLEFVGTVKATVDASLQQQIGQAFDQAMRGK